MILSPPNVSASNLIQPSGPLSLCEPPPLPRLDVQGDDAAVPLEPVLPTFLDLFIGVILLLCRPPVLLTAAPIAHDGKSGFGQRKSLAEVRRDIQLLPSKSDLSLACCVALFPEELRLFD